MRLAFAAFGVNTPVLSAVISFFMAGLALGSWWGGCLTSRSFRRFNPILFYSLCELLIGLGALVVPFFFSLGTRLLLSAGETDSGSYLFLSAAVIFLSLLPWCFCMGATFPLMMAFIKKNGGSKDSFSFLYTANVLGAMAGTAITAYILIECLGLRGTSEVASCLNLLIAYIALRISYRFPSGNTVIINKKAASSQPENRNENQTPALYLAILFTTGFVFMAMEVVWTRGYTYLLKTEVYSYASLLFTYLLSTFFGSWLYRHFRNKKTISLSAVLGLLFLCSLLPIVINNPLIHLSALYMLFTIIPVCAVLGYLTPLLIDEVSSGNAEIAGRAYAFNIVGCILGPLAASYFFLPFLGTRFSLIALSLLLAVFFINKNIRSMRFSTKAFLGVTGTVLLAIALFWTVDFEDYCSRYFSSSRLRRDYCATVVSLGSGMNKSLLVNGIGMTGLVMPTKMMAHLPLVLLSHKPLSALDICFGMGTTYRSLLSWNIDTTAVELVPSVLKSFDYFWSDADRVQSSPQAHLVVDDGRRFLKRTRETFDVITVDPPPPLEAAASSLLYSTEFYDLVKQHLKKGGLLQEWLSTGGYGTCNAAARSIQVSFPYVKVFVGPERFGVYLVASLEPIRIPNLQELREKMPISAIQDFSEWMPNQRTAFEYFGNLLSNERPIETFIDPFSSAIITDDRPFNEYYFLRKWKWVLFHSPW